MNELQSLIRQLDYLVGFLELATDKIYQEIRYKERFEYSDTLGDIYGNSCETYKNTLINSVFILGVTYFEEFISKVVEKILILHPNNNDLQLKVSDFHNYIENGIDYKAELSKKKAESYAFGLKAKIDLIKKVYPEMTSNPIDISYIYQAIEIRNCFMHKNGYAKGLSGYTDGQKILLDINFVNQYGRKVRAFSETIWSKI